MGGREAQEGGDICIYLWLIDFPGGSDGKSICLQCRRPGFDPWVGKIPWRRQWHPTPLLLPGKSHGRRSLVGYSPWGHKESHTTERLHYTMTNSCCRTEETNATLQSNYPLIKSQNKEQYGNGNKKVEQLPCSTSAGNVNVKQLRFFTTLHMSLNGHKSSANIYFRIKINFNYKKICK